jgi:ATP-dependent Clp protease ATP-binding subunit ClpA
VEYSLGDLTIPIRATYESQKEDVEIELREAFNDFFDRVLQRPEIRNRFGDNFVPLAYIDVDVAPKILDRALKNVKARVMKEHGVHLDTTLVDADLAIAAVAKRQDGGRGIGTVVESRIVNPLARWIFAEKDLAPGDTIQVTNLTEESGGRWSLQARRCRGSVEFSTQ